MHTEGNELPTRPSTKAQDGVYQEFYEHSTGRRVNTDEVIVEAIRKQYPELHLTISPTYNLSLLSFAAAGHAQATPVDEDNSLSENLKWRMYVGPAKRLDNTKGYLYDSVQFGKFLYKWHDHDFLLYSIVGALGPYSQPMTYLLGSKELNDQLMLAAGKFSTDIHDSVLVFDGGYWQKSSELWQSVQSASWDDVILDPAMKKSIVGEVTKFFDSRERYQKLRVPWKRGIIYHGPPGNGKTISIKATMHSLYSLDDPIPTLYVRSLSSYGGPEYAIKTIFSKARQMAPCFLVFEDLDSIVTDQVRSYFLNEVDGLQNNDGILMIGSTNHLERLDPGISKRPSRFDRKYLFPDPNMEQRIQYCEFWRKKLLDNDDVKFPIRLNKAIASITNGFSFAYIQEAFVSALLAIANEGTAEEETTVFLPSDSSEAERHLPKNIKVSTLGKVRVEYIEKDPYVAPPHVASDQKDLEDYVLWREIKKVIKSLREELDQENEF